MTEQVDGGYYAIKGFLYQFDTAITKVLSNPVVEVGIERKQDIDYQDFVIQVKHKETQDYQNHKIKKPVLQLLEMFKQDQSQRFCLYSYFRNRIPSKWAPSLAELDSILGNRKADYSSELKKGFVENFYIQFSEDFETQFLELVTSIQEVFSLPNKEEAILYHSLFRSKLLDLSIRTKTERRVAKSDLDDFLKDAEKTIFYTAYAKFLDRTKYERLIKKRYFTFKTVNIENFQRLFVIHCNEDANLVDLSRIVSAVSNKYFRVGKSPQPYLSFVNLDENRLIELKRDLVDRGTMFNDGTCFDGDRFRLHSIVRKEPLNNELRVKIIKRENIFEVLAEVKFHEVFQFYLETPLDLVTERDHVKIQVVETKQTLEML